MVTPATWNRAGVSRNDGMAAFEPADHHLQVGVTVAGWAWVWHILRLKNNFFHKEEQMPFQTRFLVASMARNCKRLIRRGRANPTVD